MKNKKGFTMVELLAVIVILGILSTLAIAGIRGVLKRTKESYMDSQNKMVVLAGKTYYSDHRSRLPKVIGPIEEVELQTLVDLKYIDPVKDANGELCVTETDTKKSKVFVQKVSNEEYKYNAYLYCNGKESGINDTVPPVKVEVPSNVEVLDTNDINNNTSVNTNTSTGSSQVTSVDDGVSSIFSSMSTDETFSTYHVYIVRENDTLEQILDRYKVGKEEVGNYNDLSDIKVGSKLIIPCSSDE